MPEDAVKPQKQADCRELRRFTEKETKPLRRHEWVRAPPRSQAKNLVAIVVAKHFAAYPKYRTDPLRW
jgi:hypothetical protein